jgi:hypothetical protein
VVSSFVHFWALVCGDCENLDIGICIKWFEFLGLVSFTC